MNLTITVSETGAMTMVAEGEAFELALFARSVGKAVSPAPATRDNELIDSPAKAARAAGRIVKASSSGKPPRTNSPTCRTCGGRGHRSNHCPSKTS